MVYSNRVVSVPINERDGRVPMPLDNAVTSAVYKGNGFVITSTMAPFYIAFLFSAGRKAGLIH